MNTIKQWKERLGNFRFWSIVVILGLIIIWTIFVEANRYHGEIVKLQPHEYTPEVHNYIAKMDKLYFLFPIINTILIFLISIDIFKVLVGDCLYGKLYKIVLAIAVKFINYRNVLDNQRFTHYAETLLYETGKIVVPSYEIIYRYLIVLVVYLLSLFIVDNIKKDYVKSVKSNKKYHEHKTWRTTIKGANQHRD